MASSKEHARVSPTLSLEVNSGPEEVSLSREENLRLPERVSGIGFGQQGGGFA